MRSYRPPRKRHSFSVGLLFFGSVLLGLLLSFPAAGQGNPESPLILETEVSFDPDDFHAFPQGTYQHIRLGDAYLDEMPEHIGDPQLPVVVKWFLLPADRAIERLEITRLAVLAIPGHFRPFPIMAETDQEQDPPSEPPWEPIQYPRSTGFISVAGQARLYRLAKVAIYPLEYDAPTERIRIIASMRVALHLRPLTAEEERNAIRINRPDLADDPFRTHRRWIEGLVVNPGDLDRFYPRYEIGDEDLPGGLRAKQSPYGSFISELPSTESLPVDYVIITSNDDENGNYIGDMESIFEDWAATMGVYENVVVCTIETIDANYDGYDRPARIKNFIRDALENWGTSYVLLGGDESVVPTRRLGGLNQGSPWQRPDPLGDHWYTRLGHDWDEHWNTDQDAWIGESSQDIDVDTYQQHGFSSIYLARMPARNVSEAEVMVQKTRRYFTNADPAWDGWYRTALAAAGPTNSADTTRTGLERLNGIVTAESVLVVPLSDPSLPDPWTVERLYPFVGGALVEGCPAWGDTCYLPLHHYIERRVNGVYWEGNDLFTKLNSTECPHIFYHMEHSQRDRLGRPTAYNIDPPPTSQCPNWDPTPCPSVLDGILRSIEHLDINQVLGLKNAQEHGQYMFVVSSGSWTNMMEMNSIGEAFLRAPEGGAVFYAGKAATYHGSHYKEFRRAMEIVAQDIGAPFCVALQLAIHEVWHGSASAEIAAFCDLNLLGDPQLVPLRGQPIDLAVNVVPNPIPKLGIQTIRVTVTDPVSGAPIEDALVGIRQGDLTAARQTTDSQGQVVLKGVLIQDGTDSVRVTVLKPGRTPKIVAVPVQVAAPYVAYWSHEEDDCVQGGDCDGAFEAGETVALRVTLQNLGTAASQQGFARLLPTPQVVFNLKINGDYRRQDTLLGKEKANPPATTDTFRVPMTEQGTRVEGEPFMIGTPARETFRIWREEGTGIYTVGAISPSQSPDTVFTGILTTKAIFADVTLVGEGNDQLYWNADSIWFQFRGDATEDKVRFRAEAPNWLTMNQTIMPIPALQPGDSTTVSYTADVLHDVPDRGNLVFTVTAYQSLISSTYFHSDFVVESAKPHVDLVFLDRQFGDFGCPDTSWQWTPVIQNRGSGTADSVALTLRKISGSFSVVDSVVAFSSVGPDSIASNGSFLLCGASVADTAGFTASIRREEFHNNEYYDLAEYDGGGGGGPPLPQNFEVDLADGTVLLRWDPVEEATGYWIEYGTTPGGSRTPIERIGAEASRYLVTIDLEAPGANGYDTPYYFYVSACYGNLCGLRAAVGPIYPWVREREGWPKLLPGMPICAPLVGDLGAYFEGEGKAIFAALHKVYAWRPGGTPLDSSSSDGSICDPWNVGQNPPGVDERFTEALAFGDWNTATEVYGPEIIGNFRGRGVALMGIEKRPGEPCCDCGPGPFWTHSQFSNLSPIVASEILPEQCNIYFLAGTADSYIYAWDANDPTLPIGDYEHHFAWYPDGSSYNYRSLAIGYKTSIDPDQRWHEVIAITRQGSLYCYQADFLEGGGDLRWQLQLDPVVGDQKYEFLSTPAVGDVDGDGDNDIVVTSLWRQESNVGSCGGTQWLVPGWLYIVDENSASVLSTSSCGFHFRQASGDFPPVGPALAQLDDNPGLEIIVPSVAAKGIDEASYPVSITLQVFEYENGNIVVHTASDSIPFNQRNDEAGHPLPDWPGVQYPIGTLIVGDFDPDGGHEKPDIFVTTSQGAIFAFEYDYQADPPLYPKRGWPLLLPDVAREPVLAELDPVGDPGQFSLVVQCQDGWLHVYDLPKTSTSSFTPAWPSYGADGGNTRGKLSGVSPLVPPGQPEVHEGSASATIVRIRPSPSRGEQEVVLASGRTEEVELEIYDVGGRRVRTVYRGTIQPGATILRWDGRLGNGLPAPSGIYWYCLRARSGEQTRRIVVVR